MAGCFWYQHICYYDDVMIKMFVMNELLAAESTDLGWVGAELTLIVISELG